MITSQNLDALLNEYKGSIFEFLVAKELSTLSEIEADFLNQLSENQLNMLSQQEQFLRSNYPNLLTSLPILAKYTANELNIKLNLSDITSVQLMGMNANASSEKDILIINKYGDETPVSLKLSKAGSFTNTKSAGAKSFFEKYFDIDQTEFNQLYEKDFRELAYSMYLEAGEEPSSDFNHWEQIGKPTLPGKLEGVQKELLLDFYKKINTRIFHVLENLLKTNPTKFLAQIAPLTGFSNLNLIQTTTFYKTVNNKYELDQLKILTHKDLFPRPTATINLKMAEHSLEMVLDKFKLQVRVKPMNKFTHKSYKINCALKIN